MDFTRRIVRKSIFYLILNIVALQLFPPVKPKVYKNADFLQKLSPDSSFEPNF